MSQLHNNAVILARVSSKGQEDEGYSLESQVKLLKLYCDNNGLNTRKIYKIAESASKSEQRKTFKDAMQFIAENKIKNLVVEKVDRHVRNLHDAVETHDWLLADENRKVHFVKDSLVMQKNSRSQEWLNWGIRVVMAKNYIDNLREEAMKGWAEKLAQGWLPSPPPPGYHTITQDGKRIHVPNPQTARSIKELNDQLDAMRLPAEKLLATGQVPTFANGYAMLGQVATKLSQITTVGQVSAETALTPLKPWLESHLPVMTEYVESQGMKFNSKIEPNLAVNLTREALAQIVSSLIGNAVKFSKAGAEIGLTIVPQGDMIHLAVQDTGVGIAKDKLAQLMQPFARGTDVLAYDYEGIGLSLYLDRLIVERVGGELTMQSVVGKGTTVSLLLPRAGK